MMTHSSVFAKMPVSGSMLEGGREGGRVGRRELQLEEEEEHEQVHARWRIVPVGLEAVGHQSGGVWIDGTHGIKYQY